MPNSDTTGAQALALLRACVHCGFCTATCPTYQVTGDELDSPRGRLHLMRSLLEGNAAGARTRHHLDRCLHCLGCETACPSGVRYGAILGELLPRLPRPRRARLTATLLRAVVPSPRRLALLLGLARAVAPLLPRPLRPPPRPAPAGPWPTATHPRRMLLLESCAQAALAPRTNAAGARLLDRLGIELRRVPAAGCCGELHRHLGAPEAARACARRNIDAWWPLIEAGAEAVVITASGCGSAVKDYGRWLAEDPLYCGRGAHIGKLARDLSEVVAAEWRPGSLSVAPRRVALHEPCSLQHAQRLGGTIERLLTAAGHQVLSAAEPHLCCGAAGPYMLMQPRLSAALRSRKLAHLGATEPEVIATANIGCQIQLQNGSRTPVVHWVELMDEHNPG